MFNSS